MTTDKIFWGKLPRNIISHLFSEEKTPKYIRRKKPRNNIVLFGGKNPELTPKRIRRKKPRNIIVLFGGKNPEFTKKVMCKHLHIDNITKVTVEYSTCF